MIPEGVVGGSVGALVIAVSYVLKLALDYLREKRAGDAVADTTPVTNAATANQLLRETLESVAGDRKETRERLDKVEAELRKERLIREAQAKRIDEHDREIGHIKRQFVLAVTYIRSLLAFITDRGLSDDAPTPPSGLHID